MEENEDGLGNEMGYMIGNTYHIKTKKEAKTQTQNKNINSRHY